ncbi:hypothetical protein JCM17823_29500 [Halorubrum gandharaense]
MTDELRRRTLLGSVAVGVGAGIAGCADDEAPGDDGDADSSDQDDEPADDSDTPEGTETEPVLDAGTSVFLALAPDRIAAVDPETGEVLADTEDVSGVSWGDARQLSNGDVYACDGSRAQAVVLDPATMTVEARIDVGPDPVHMFEPRPGEAWVHSDDEGRFHVIDAAERTVVDTVDSGLDEGGHGKLVTHESLDGAAYGTNVTSAAATTIDVDAREQTGHVELCDGAGTHYGAYSPWNGHAYFECTDGRLAIVDTETDERLDAREYGGGLYVGAELLGIVDGNTVHFLDATSADDERVASVELDEGGPDTLGFHEADGTTYAFAANTGTPDVTVIDVDAETIVDRIGAGDIERPDDADHLHRAATTGDGYYATPADADGVLAVIDMAARERVALAEVGEGVDTVTYLTV